MSTEITIEPKTGLFLGDKWTWRYLYTVPDDPAAETASIAGKLAGIGGGLDIIGLEANDSKLALHFSILSKRWNVEKTLAAFAGPLTIGTTSPELIGIFLDERTWGNTADGNPDPKTEAPPWVKGAWVYWREQLFGIPTTDSLETLETVLEALPWIVAALILIGLLVAFGYASRSAQALAP